MGRLALAIALLVGTGCRQLLGFENPTSTIGDGPPIDSDPPGDIGSELMPVDGCTSFSTVVDTCATTALGPLSIGGAIYNTSTFILDVGGVLSTPQHVVYSTPTGEVTALFATTFTLSGSLRVIGSRPIAIIAIDQLAILASAQLDVAAGGAGTRGVMACPTERGGTGSIDVGGSSGGGGAGYKGAGGNGGNGDSDGGQSAGGAAGASRLKPQGPLGGCPGGNGGNNGGNNGGDGGAGGGALLLAAGNGISILGLVNAGGGGGLGGKPGSGGGGGGSGGMIILEGPSVALAAAGAITANGGGGGEGGGVVANGSNGSPGNKIGTQAPGGSAGAATGADGGSGSGSGQNFGGTPSTVQADGGGGGGGAAGFIAIGTASEALDGTVSPTNDSWP